MRPTHALLVLAVAALVASSIGAPAFYEDRPAGLGRDVFVHESPKSRAEWAKENKALGAALGAYEQMVQADEDDHEAVWQAIRSLLLVSGTGYSEPRLHERLAGFLTLEYPRVRARVDPDGKRLRAAVEEWQRLRLESEQLYIKAGTAIWLAARGGEMGRKRIGVFLEKGPFYREFFSYVASERPHWRVVEPVIEHYLTGDDLRGRVEAGTALLEHHALYGVGAELLERSLRDIRAAFREYKAGLKPGLDPIEQARAETCVYGLALLARRGHQQERRILVDLWEQRLSYPEVAPLLRIARRVARLEEFRSLRPGQSKFELLPQQAKEYYYRGLALHYLDIRDDAEREDEVEWAHETLDDGTLDAYGIVSYTSHLVLARFEPERREKAAKTSPLYALRLHARDPKNADVETVVAWLSHPNPGYAGLAAAILRSDLPAVPLLQD